MNQSQSRGSASGSAFKPVLVVGLVVLGMAAFTWISKLNPPKEIIPWRSDYFAAEAEARSADKPLFLYFTADWCAACQQMKKTTWSAESVDRALNDYVPVKIDVDAKPELGIRYQADYLPAIRVVKSDGRVFAPQISAFQNNEELVEWLRSVK